MLITRRIRITILAFFALGIVFPPSWVLCMEPTGEVRVEYAGIECCDVATDPSAARAAMTRGTDDCDGCRDVAVSLPALRSTRMHTGPADALIATTAMPAGLPPVLQLTRTTFRAAPRPTDPTLAILATTVILR